MAVRIYLEIGHEASIRTKKTQEGFTHDWEVFVRGCDGAEIHYFIEKVVFYLHETFPKPKRVVKEPPYAVKESGYAGFNLPIDIYLRNSNEPKKIRFNYDLHLQQSGPPILKVQKEKYVFNSPTDDFKMKLLKGGGTIGSSSSSTQEVNDSRPSFEDKNQMINKPKLSGSDFIKKQKMKIGEPCRDFQELFGSPINMTKSSEQRLQPPKQDSKDRVRKHSPHKESHKDKDKSKDKTESEKKNRDEKKQKDKSKDRERSKDKSIKKERSPRPKSPSPKRAPTPSRFSSPPVVKHKESKHDKERKEDRKPKKDKKNKEHKENKHEQKSGGIDEHKEKNRDDNKKESSKLKLEPPLPTNSPPEKKEKSSKEKSSKDSLKEDKYSEKYKHKKKDKEKRDKKEEKPYTKPEKKQESNKQNLFKNEPKKEKVSNYHNPPPVEDESSNSSALSSSSSSVELKPEKKSKSEPVKIKEEKNIKVKKEKGYQENTIKCKRKSDSVEADEPLEKIHKEHNINNNSDVEQENAKTVLPTAPEGVEEDYFGVLRDLQHKIMGLKDNSDLQKVVKLIAETGRYEVSAHTFDFDLCLLDRSTVQQLQEFFASET